MKNIGYFSAFYQRETILTAYGGDVSGPGSRMFGILHETAPQQKKRLKI